MWCRLTLCHRRFGTTYRYHIEESSSQRRVSSLTACPLNMKQVVPKRR
jgi:hypothetical protein